MSEQMDGRFLPLPLCRSVSCVTCTDLLPLSASMWVCALCAVVAVLLNPWGHVVVSSKSTVLLPPLLPPSLALSHPPAWPCDPGLGLGTQGRVVSLLEDCLGADLALSRCWQQDWEMLHGSPLDSPALTDAIALFSGEVTYTCTYVERLSSS